MMVREICPICTKYEKYVLQIPLVLGRCINVVEICFTINELLVYMSRGKFSIFTLGLTDQLYSSIRFT